MKLHWAALERLLSAVRDGVTDTAIVAKLDRLGRTMLYLFAPPWRTHAHIGGRAWGVNRRPPRWTRESDSAYSGHTDCLCLLRGATVAPPGDGGATPTKEASLLPLQPVTANLATTAQPGLAPVGVRVCGTWIDSSGSRTR